MTPNQTDSTKEFEAALAAPEENLQYAFRLYVTGSTPRSLRAIQNLRNMCEARLKGQYSLEVVDIFQQPDQAQAGQVVVTPTLVKSLPLPKRTVIGDLSDVDRVLISLDIVPRQNLQAQG